VCPSPSVTNDHRNCRNSNGIFCASGFLVNEIDSLIMTWSYTTKQNPKNIKIFESVLNITGTDIFSASSFQIH
jgi:hypothetical protein